jgi:hypothetical protein
MFHRRQQERKLDVFFPPKKPKMFAGRWWGGYDRDPRKSESTMILRSTYCISYHLPTLAHVVDTCKWKERDEGRRPKNQKSTAKQVKRTKDQAQKEKFGSKKGRPEEENFVKKQASR